MNYRLTTALLAIALVFALGVNTGSAAPPKQPFESVQYAAPAGDYDFGTYGTAWIPEVRGQFSLFTPKGWGTEVKSTAVASRWVHIPIPVATRIAGTRMKLKYVEFCAKSSNGASTSPIQIDMYDNNGAFFSTGISWWADNNMHCWGQTFTPFAFENLGISVLLHFANTSHKITLFKAWARVVP